MPDDRRAVLEAIAYGNDPKLTPGDRLRALEMLGSREPDDRFVFDLSGLTGESLDRELAGFFDTGAPPPPLPGEPVALPDRYERQVKKRVAAQVKRMARDLDRRIQVAAQQLAGSSEKESQPGGQVVYLTPAAERLTPEAERVRREIIEERRAALPPGVRQHVPPGIDPRAIEQAWPSRRR